VIRAYTRVHELCQQVGETPQLFFVLVGLRRFYAFAGELQTAQELAEQLWHLARQQSDAVYSQEAHWALGQTLYFRGEFVSARTHLEQSLACYAPQPLSTQLARSAAGTQIACRFIAAWNLWMLGYPDQALNSLHEALRLAHELAHPFTLAVALYGLAVLHQLRREVQAVHERAEALMALASEQGYSRAQCVPDRAASLVPPVPMKATSARSR
jgi:tetratricopeptide (TPR) repeat protein